MRQIMRRYRLITGILGKTLFIALLFLALTSLCNHWSQATNEPATEPATGKNIECQLVSTQTIKYVEKPVPVVKYVDRVIKVPVNLQNFHDVDQLKQWLSRESGSINTVYFQSPDDCIDCDDYASTLQQMALSDGFLLSFEIIGAEEYNRLFQELVLPPDSLHAINLAIIGNRAYYIEPQTNEVALATLID